MGEKSRPRLKGRRGDSGNDAASVFPNLIPRGFAAIFDVGIPHAVFVNVWLPLHFHEPGRVNNAHRDAMFANGGACGNCSLALPELHSGVYCGFKAGGADWCVHSVWFRLRWRLPTPEHGTPGPACKCFFRWWGIIYAAMYGSTTTGAVMTPS